MYIIKPVVGLYGVLEKSEEGWQDASKIVTQAARMLSGAGLKVVVAHELVYDEHTALKAARQFSAAEVDLVIPAIITWSFDNLTVTIQRKVDVPLAILSMPGIRTGSLVGAQQLGSYLTELEIPYAFFYGDPAQSNTYQPISAFARAAAAKKRLSQGTIGVVGRRTPGMTPIAVDEMEITKTFGPRLITWGWDEIEEVGRSIKKDEIQARVDQMTRNAGTCSCSKTSLHDSARLTCALHGLVKRDNLVALSLGCYPHYAGRVCMACSLLGDEGIPCGCEGDTNSAIAMYLLQAFTGRPVHFGEMLEINETENSIITSHCGCCPAGLANKKTQINVTPVRLFDRGASIRFPAKGGIATYVNLVGRKDTYRMCAVQGEATPVEMVFDGNPVKITIDSDVKRLLETVGARGFGHHWMMGYGHVRRELESFTRLCGINGVFPADSLHRN